MSRFIFATCGLVLAALLAAGECRAQDVRAQDRSVAAGRDIVKSTIIIGIPPEQLPSIIATARKDLEDLSQQQK
jgi:hypothetical protein